MCAKQNKTNVAEGVKKMEVLDKYNVIWDTLGSSSLDSMPIGNGDIGLNVWTEQNGDLVFYMSKTDAWSENGRLLKLGKVRVSLTPNPFIDSTSFIHKLSVKDGIITIKSGQENNETQIRIWVDAHNPAVSIGIESQMAVDAKVAFEPWRTNRRELSGQEADSAYGLEGDLPIFVEPDTIVASQNEKIVWYHRNERSVWKANLELQALGEQCSALSDPLLGRTFGALIEGDGLVGKSETLLVTDKPKKKLTISICTLTVQTSTPEAWIEEVKGNSARILAIPYDQRIEAHMAWWRTFWERSHIHVSSSDSKQKQITDKITRGYILQRWMNACSGRGNSPIKFNGSIFNVDTMNYDDEHKLLDADYRQWGGCYWWQNTRLPYWSMLTSGDCDLMGPLFRMYSNILPIREAATKKYYGHEGAFIPETMCFWGTYADSNYGSDRTDKPDGYTKNDYIRYYWQSGLELSLMMLDYYQHTQDKEFAEKTLLPFVGEIITFYDQHWGRDTEGKIYFEPAMALETYREAVNPLVEIVGIAKVCTELLSLPEMMVTDVQSSQWKRLILELPDIPVKEVDGEKVLVPAEQYSGKQNQENPELYGIFPYRTYGIGRDDIELARRTFEQREFKGSGGWYQNAIKAACLGFADEAAKCIVHNFTHKDERHRFDAMWGPNFDWTPDQDHGGVAMIALQKMLVQYDGDKIWIFPAWLEKWDVDFKLHAPQNTVIEGSLRDGKIVSLEVEPCERRKDITVSDNIKNISLKYK